MNKKGEQNTLMVVIIGIMIIMIGLAFANSIANTKATQTDKVNIVDELVVITAGRLSGGASINTTYPFTLVNAPTGWKISECPLGSVVVGNSTLAYTLTTDYTLNLTSGVLLYKNTSNVFYGGNNTYVDYNYCADGYLTSSGDRGIANLWTTLVILVIIVFVAGLGYSLWNKR